MRTLSAAELLNVWERGLASSLAQRALTLLATACPDITVEQLGQLSIGQRDARLLELRERTFGPQFVSLVICPECAERLEFSINADDLRPPLSTQSISMFTVKHGCYEVRFSLPNSLILAALDPASDAETNRLLVFKQCIVVVHRDGLAIPVEELPAHVIAAVEERMAEADPQAVVELSLSCPECHYAWLAPLDIVSYFWIEIHAWASRLLRDVHALASAYGWREADVLALSPWRRQAYLEMLEQ